MKKVFIVGGSGKVGRRLAKRLAERGYQPVTMYRNDDQTEELRALGAEPVIGSLIELDENGLAKLMQGCDAVVFSAGAGGEGGEEMTNAIDGRGLELSVEAARRAGIKRFLLVSAFPEAGRERTPSISDTFENYMKVKKQADVYLAETDLDWVILRPGTLTDDPGAGKVRTGLAIPYGNVSRDDVAAVLFEIIERPEVNRIIIELTEGDTPVGESVQRLARR